MKKTKEIDLEFKGEKIIVSELTVKQVSETLAKIGDAGELLIKKKELPSAFELLFGTECSEIVISVCTGITIVELNDDFAPSDIRILIDEVKSLNLFFFEMLAKLYKVQAAIQASTDLLPKE